MKPAIQTLLLNFFRKNHNAEFAEVSKETQKAWGLPEHLHDIIRIRDFETNFEMYGVVSVKTDRFEKVAFRDDLYRKLPNRDQWILIAVDTEHDIVQWLSVPDVDKRLKDLEYRTSGRGETVFLVPWVNDYWADPELDGIWPDTDELHGYDLEAFLQRYTTTLGSNLDSILKKIVKAHKDKAEKSCIDVCFRFTPTPEDPLHGMTVLVNINQEPRPENPAKTVS